MTPELNESALYLQKELLEKWETSPVATDLKEWGVYVQAGRKKCNFFLPEDSDYFSVEFDEWGNYIFRREKFRDAEKVFFEIKKRFIIRKLDKVFAGSNTGPKSRGLLKTEKKDRQRQEEWNKFLAKAFLKKDLNQIVGMYAKEMRDSDYLFITPQELLKLPFIKSLAKCLAPGELARLFEFREDETLVINPGIFSKRGEILINPIRDFLRDKEEWNTKLKTLITYQMEDLTIGGGFNGAFLLKRHLEIMGAKPVENRLRFYMEKETGILRELKAPEHLYRGWLDKIESAYKYRTFLTTLLGEE